jgi:hypothetical protein
MRSPMPTSSKVAADPSEGDGLWRAAVGSRPAHVRVGFPRILNRPWYGVCCG